MWTSALMDFAFWGEGGGFVAEYTLKTWVRYKMQCGARSGETGLVGGKRASREDKRIGWI